MQKALESLGPFHRDSTSVRSCPSSWPAFDACSDTPRTSSGSTLVPAFGAGLRDPAFDRKPTDRFNGAGIGILHEPRPASCLPSTFRYLPAADAASRNYRPPQMALCRTLSATPFGGVNRRKRALGKGEKEVLALGLETEASLLILDDRSGRQHASVAGLEVTGTLGVLLLAKERHVLDSVRPMLDRLQELRFRPSAGIRQAVLDAADERD